MGLQILSAVVQPAVTALSPPVQAVYLQCALKVLGQYANICIAAEAAGGAPVEPSWPAAAAALCSSLDRFACSKHVEVQERATCTLLCAHVAANPPLLWGLD